MKLSIFAIAAFVAASSAMAPNPFSPGGEGLNLHNDFIIGWTPNLGDGHSDPGDPTPFYLYLVDVNNQSNCYLLGSNIPRLPGHYQVPGNSVSGSVPRAPSYVIRFHRAQTCDHDLPGGVNNNFAETNQFVVLPYN